MCCQFSFLKLPFLQECGKPISRALVMPTSGYLDSLLKYRYIQILVRGLATYKIYGEVKHLQNLPLEAPESLNLNARVIFTFEKAYSETILHLK